MICENPVKINIFTGILMELEKEIKQKKFDNIYERVLVNIIYSSSWLNHIVASFLKGYGLTQQQYNILRILRGQYPQPASINLLIERMLDKMSNASRLVDKLLLKGLVDRKMSQKDHRKVDVLINKKGLSLLERIDGEISIVFQKLKSINVEEAEELNRILDKLRDVKEDPA